MIEPDCQSPYSDIPLLDMHHDQLSMEKELKI